MKRQKVDIEVERISEDDDISTMDLLEDYSSGNLRPSGILFFKEKPYNLCYRPNPCRLPLDCFRVICSFYFRGDFSDVLNFLCLNSDFFGCTVCSLEEILITPENLMSITPIVLKNTHRVIICNTHLPTITYRMFTVEEIEYVVDNVSDCCRSLEFLVRLSELQNIIRIWKSRTDAGKKNKIERFSFSNECYIFEDEQVKDQVEDAMCCTDLSIFPNLRKIEQPISMKPFQHCSNIRKISANLLLGMNKISYDFCNNIDRIRVRNYVPRLEELLRDQKNIKELDITLKQVRAYKRLFDIESSSTSIHNTLEDLTVRLYSEVLLKNNLRRSGRKLILRKHKLLSINGEARTMRRARMMTPVNWRKNWEFNTIPDLVFDQSTMKNLKKLVLVDSGSSGCYVPFSFDKFLPPSLQHLEIRLHDPKNDRRVLLGGLRGVDEGKKIFCCEEEDAEFDEYYFEYNPKQSLETILHGLHVLRNLDVRILLKFPRYRYNGIWSATYKAYIDEILGSMTPSMFDMVHDLKLSYLLRIHKKVDYIFVSLGERHCKLYIRKNKNHVSHVNVEFQHCPAFFCTKTYLDDLDTIYARSVMWDILSRILEQMMDCFRLSSFIRSIDFECPCCEEQKTDCFWYREFKKTVLKKNFLKVLCDDERNNISCFV